MKRYALMALSAVVAAPTLAFVQGTRDGAVNEPCSPASKQMMERRSAAERTNVSLQMVAAAGTEMVTRADAGPNDRTIPQVAAAAGSFDTLLAAVKAAGLAEALSGAGPFTVFAPTDDAFAKLPAGTIDTLLAEDGRVTLKRILLHHVVAERLEASDLQHRDSVQTLAGTTLDLTQMRGGLRIAGVDVQSADIAASNGVIHVIGDVLIPPAPEASKTIPEIAVGSDQLTTLVTAVTAADLLDALSGAGPFTVFAPTDAAFAKLPAGTIDTLLAEPDRVTLKRILLHHVVADRLEAADLQHLDSVQTLAGTTLDLTRMRGGLRIAGAGVAAADVSASNGVVHVIDQVLIPPAPSPLDQLLTGAIDRGVPLFNAGNPEACAAVCATALDAVTLCTGWGLSSSEIDRIAGAAREAAAVRAADDRAWSYRRIIDSLLARD